MTEKKDEEFTQIALHVQKGTIISSTKGILLKSPITKQFYIVKKVKVEGHSNGSSFFVALGDKTPIDVKVVKE